MLKRGFQPPFSEIVLQYGASGTCAFDRAHRVPAGSRRWRRGISTRSRSLADHQVRDENGKVVGYRDLDKIGKTLVPVLIRRNKNQVLQQLPERLDKNFFVPMTPEQRVHHEQNRDVVAKIAAKWRRCKFLSEADQRRLMIGLQNMRMSCDSTYLVMSHR